MTNDAGTGRASASAEDLNPDCPHCGETLSGSDLKNLKCPGCGEELPPRLGI